MTPLCFIDTETTSLRPDRRAWEIGIVARHPGKPDKEHHWFIGSEDLDLGNADLSALKIGRFYERHPDINPDASPRCWPERRVLREVEEVIRGAHLVGAVVNFDAEVLAARMREHGICPSWHYHLIDVEALTVGYLNGRRARQNEIVDGYPLENGGKLAPGLVRWNEPVTTLPWKSDDLSDLLGIAPASTTERHTALGDARWAMRIYDAVMDGAS